MESDRIFDFHCDGDHEEDTSCHGNGCEDDLIWMMVMIMVVILLVMMATMKALSLLEYSNNFYSKRGKGQWSQSKCFVTQQIANKLLSNN